jgi:hypothetical protein
MKQCIFCDREHNEIFIESKFKYCEYCKKEMDEAKVKAIIQNRKDELKSR